MFLTTSIPSEPGGSVLPVVFASAADAHAARGAAPGAARALLSKVAGRLGLSADASVAQVFSAVESVKSRADVAKRTRAQETDDSTAEDALFARFAGDRPAEPVSASDEALWSKFHGQTGGDRA